MRLYKGMRLASLGSLLLFAACGGGGGAGDSGSVTPQIEIQFASASVAATSVQGFSVGFATNFSISGSVVGDTLQAFDSTNGLSNLQILPSGGFDYEIDLASTRTLPVGHTRGTLTIKDCDSAQCNKVYGSASIPYDITVQPLVNLTPLTPFTGLSEWQTYHRDNAHDNFVPVTLDATKFNSRWLIDALDVTHYPSQILVGSTPVTDSANRRIVTLTMSGLVAFDENDGSELWHVEPSDGVPGFLALYSGTVYAEVTGNRSASAFLEAYSDSSGSAVFDQSISACGGYCYASGDPVVVGNTAFVMLNPTGLPIAAFDASAGTPKWVGPGLSGYGTLAADTTDLYFYEPNYTAPPGIPQTPMLSALDQATGTLQWQRARPIDPSTISYVPLHGETVILDGNGGALFNDQAQTVDGSPIERYDLATGARSWMTSVSTLFSSFPDAIAVGNGMVYAGTSGDTGIAAVDLNTGAVKWTWTAPVGGDVDCLLLTNNLLFVGGHGAVYAIDLVTQQTVWTFPLPALSLAISPNGILYLNAPVDGVALAAINLH